MGANSSINQNNYDTQWQNLKDDLSLLVFDAKSLLAASAETESSTSSICKYKALKNLIEKDIKQIEDFLNSSYELSLGAFSINDDKLSKTANTLLAEDAYLDSKSYNIFKSNDKNVFDYEQKLMAFIKEYSSNGECYNSIFNKGNKKFIRGKKLIFSSNLNENNFIAEQLIFVIPPISSTDITKFSSLTSEIKKHSKDLTPQENKLLSSEDLNNFMSSSSMQAATQENNFDTLMKFLFILFNHDVVLYAFGSEYDREADLFRNILNNSFLKSVLKHKKLLLIFPNEKNTFDVFKSSQQKDFKSILNNLNTEVFYVHVVLLVTSFFCLFASD